jgi:ketosteroid isomerase-like protein
MRLSPALAITLLTTACAPAPLTPAHRTAIVDSVQVMLTSWRDAMNTKDFARAASFYSNQSDFRWFQDGELKYRSGKEIGDTMQAAAPGLRSFTLSLIEPEITPLAPGIAVLTTNFAQKITDTTGQTIGFAGAITATIVHADSGWRFLVGHTSAIIPPRDTSSKAPGRRT